MSCTQVVPAAMAGGDCIGHCLPSAVGVAPDPQHAAAEDQQVRTRVIDLFDQGLGPGALLV